MASGGHSMRHTMSWQVPDTPSTPCACGKVMLQRPRAEVSHTWSFACSRVSVWRAIAGALPLAPPQHVVGHALLDNIWLSDTSCSRAACSSSYATPCSSLQRSRSVASAIGGHPRTQWCDAVCFPGHAGVVIFGYARRGGARLEAATTTTTHVARRCSLQPRKACCYSTRANKRRPQTALHAQQGASAQRLSRSIITRHSDTFHTQTPSTSGPYEHLCRTEDWRR